MKYAVVTGGTKGIGKAIVKYLLKKSYFVFTNYAFDSTAANNAQKEFKKISDSFYIGNADQGNEKEFRTFIHYVQDKCKYVNCIVCNSGSTVRKPSYEITNNEWRKIFEISVNSHFFLIRDLYSRIEENSRIIFIGSMMGVLPHSTSLAYGVSKSAVHALAKNLVKDFEGKGTTVNAIVPGFVETEWQKDKPVYIRKNIYDKTACARFGTTDEIVSAVDFCMNNAFVNGSLIEVNGGYSYK